MRKSTCATYPDQAKHDIAKLEEFFFGNYYAMLTDVDPHYLLDKLKEAIENDKLELPG